MTNPKVAHEIREVVMPFTREKQSLNVIESAYQVSGEVEYSKALYYLRKEQKDMLEELADVNGTSQVAILRAIIDEWRKMKLGGCNGQGG